MDEKFFFDAMAAVGMEVVVVDENTPFGRQPKPVRVILNGEKEDVAYWRRELMKRAEFKGDMTQSLGDYSFTIYPRAVND